ncbi:hypothetical protein SDJN03_14052, partial [Cucurbita argyrosperma subsp. sororia]
MLSISSVQFDHFLHRHGISPRKIVLRSVWLALNREEKKTEKGESPSSTVPLCLRITRLLGQFTLVEQERFKVNVICPFMMSIIYNCWVELVYDKCSF